jgi:hypothetical protein
MTDTSSHLSGESFGSPELDSMLKQGVRYEEISDRHPVVKNIDDIVDQERENTERIAFMIGRVRGCVDKYLSEGGCDTHILAYADDVFRSLKDRLNVVTKKESSTSKSTTDTDTTHANVLPTMSEAEEKPVDSSGQRKDTVKLGEIAGYVGKFVFIKAPKVVAKGAWKVAQVGWRNIGHAAFIKAPTAVAQGVGKVAQAGWRNKGSLILGVGGGFVGYGSAMTITALAGTPIIVPVAIGMASGLALKKFMKWGLTKSSPTP